MSAGADAAGSRAVVGREGTMRIQPLLSQGLERRNIERTTNSGTSITAIRTTVDTGTDMAPRRCVALGTRMFAPLSRSLVLPLSSLVLVLKSPFAKRCQRHCEAPGGTSAHVYSSTCGTYQL